MHSRFIKLSEEQFDVLFPPVPNHINTNSSWVFDSIGPEYQFVREQPANHVWSITDGHDGYHYARNGFQPENCYGYLVSKVPSSDHARIEVRMDFESHF